ncbi:phosphodiester glycosidase family protein [Clostridium lacusfryxellense]|uniref:phosphodiester glycosidase family protein n=1 Tax=Clostridium lacusfryxellense TaxID=205328 RepID=UPI001C0D9CFE|nr:phosphodiester glycosidase family protein [Clostridium lacusfryxellense]MBU3114466.1 phosphodiester glycosidase family protein [Clostridium lacusfryxellense]
MKAKKTIKKKKPLITLVILFIVFELTFTAVTGPFVVYYGPFKNAKNIIVGSVMTTLTLQWLATTFLSDEKIKEIMDEQTVETIVQDNVKVADSDVKVEKKNDNGIERYDVSGKTFVGYLLVINDPTRIKVGYTSMLYKEGERTSEIAKNNNAVAAINGGAFTDRVAGVKWAGTGAMPLGIIMSNGKNIHNDIKDENLKKDVVALTKSGKLLVGPHSIKEMKDDLVTEAVSFGPALIVNGKKTMKKGNNGSWGISGRTAIAQRKDGAIMLLVVDGRQVKSLGATLKEVQDLLYDNGAVNASNLDGGSSATMVYNDEIINSPSDGLGERAIPSIIYVESRK